MILKIIFLPRQARDKHRESTQNRDALSLGIAAGQVLPHVASMADVAPTVLELIGGTARSAPYRASMDGASWAPLLLARNGSMNGGTVTPVAKFAR